MAIDTYVRTETRFSIAGSVLVTILFYSLAFGIGGRVPVGGWGGYAFDFGPQSFMTALICTWLPGVVTRKRMQSNHAALRYARLGNSSLIMTGLIAGLATLLVGGGSIVALLFALGIATIDWGLGLAIKCVFAAVVAMIITPIGLRRLLVGG
ncbi:MAG: hypothetical protein ACTHLU_04385 [Novosphingobium sp.]